MRFSNCSQEPVLSYEGFHFQKVDQQELELKGGGVKQVHWCPSWLNISVWTEIGMVGKTVSAFSKVCVFVYNGVPRNFFRVGVQQIQLKTEGREKFRESGVPLNLQMSETHILIRMLWIYFPRISEFVYVMKSFFH
jgi:hypothetical protein